MHRHRRGQFEGCDPDVEGLVGGVDHLEAALHRAERGAEGAEGRVFEMLAWIEYRVLADHAGTTNFLDMSVGVGDDPVTALESHSFVSAVGDADPIGKEPQFRSRFFGHERRPDHDRDAKGCRLRAALSVIHHRSTIPDPAEPEPMGDRPAPLGSHQLSANSYQPEHGFGSAFCRACLLLSPFSSYFWSFCELQSRELRAES